MVNATDYRPFRHPGAAYERSEQAGPGRDPSTPKHALAASFAPRATRRAGALVVVRSQSKLPGAGIPAWSRSGRSGPRGAGMTLEEAARDARTASGTASMRSEWRNLHDVENVLDVSLTPRNSFAQAHADTLVSQRPLDVERVGPGDPNIDVVACLETHGLEDLGRQPNGEFIVPL